MTRYKLDIPEKIDREHSWVANALHGLNMQIGDDFTFEHYHFHGIETYGFEDIPKEWLTEVKEPVSRDDLINGCLDEICDIVDMHGMRSEFWSAVGRLVDKVEQKNELRHRETKSFEDILVEFQNNHEWDDETYSVGMYFWQACKESHSIK